MVGPKPNEQGGCQGRSSGPRAGMMQVLLDAHLPQTGGGETLYEIWVKFPSIVTVEGLIQSKYFRRLGVFSHLEEVFMIRSFRQMAVAAAVMAAASSAFAGIVEYEFKSFYDNSTVLNPTDKQTLDYVTKGSFQSIATLSLTDIAGGVQGTLKFTDTTFPGGKTGLTVDELWLGSSDKTKGVVAGSGLRSGLFYKNGFSQEGSKYNYDIEFKAGSFKEGLSSTFTIKGAGITASDFNMQNVMLEITGAGKPYTGLLGLNSNVHFIGTALPEPSTYVLMGLGLAGIAAVARKRKAA
jgi:hypothetical protein